MTSTTVPPLTAGPGFTRTAVPEPGSLVSTRSTIDRITTVLLCLSLFGSSAEGVIVLMPGGSAVNRIVGFLLLSAFGLSLIEGRRIRPAAGIGKHLGVIYVWVLLTTSWGVALVGTRQLVLLAQLPLLAIILYQMCDRPTLLRIAMLAYGLGGLVGTINVIVAWTNKHGVAYTERYTIGTIDPNYSGIIVASSAVVLWFAARDVPVLNVLRFPATIASAFALLLTGSRGSMVTTAVCFAYALIDSIIKQRIIAIIAGILTVFVAVGVLRTDIVPQASRDRVESALDSQSTTARERRNAWEVGIERFYDRPVQGTGFDSFSSFTTDDFLVAINAHNDYVRYLVELGLIGLLLIVLALVRIWRWSTSLAARTCMLTVTFSGISLDLALRKAYWIVLAVVVAHGTLDRSKERAATATHRTSANRRAAT